MTFALKVGDAVKLTAPIKSTYACDDWKTGTYKVTQISYGYGTALADHQNPKCQTYYFAKVKKDGTRYQKTYGYNCMAFDRKFVVTGIATVITNKGH